MSIKKNRKTGFYWVHIKDRWVVAEYDGTYWHYQGGSYVDEQFKFIDEDRLYNPNERDT